MAYEVSNDYRTVVYSGGALYDCRLKVNNVLVPISQISTIKISSPIIDTTTETGSMFHIGTFISQKLDIKFRNLNGLTLNNNPIIELEIGLKIGNNYEYVPIGVYMIDELAENYQKTCEITCLDYAVKFKSNIDISQFFNENNYIEAGDLFEAICGYYGVEVGTYPEVNNDKQIFFYDNTLTGKDYISYLAELFGGNAKIERDGSCSIIPLKNYTEIEINALTSKKFEIGDTYVLSRVCYDNGVQKFQAGGNVISVDELPSEDIDENSFYYLTTDLKYYRYVNNEWQEDTTIKNTLYIRNENLFITDQLDISAIYEAVSDFTVTNIKCENRMDFSLDSWDIVKYNTTNGNYYYVLYDNIINYNGVAMGTVETKIPLKTTEETTNIIASSDTVKIRKIQTTVNEQELKIETVVEDIGDRSEKSTTVTQDLDGLQIAITSEADGLQRQINTINTTLQGLVTEKTTIGGQNLIKNSVGYFGHEYWQIDNENEGTVYGNSSTDVKQHSTSGSALELRNETIYQAITEIKNGSYYLSFTYKRLINTAVCKLSVNETEITLNEDDWTEVEQPIEITGNSITLQILADINDSCLITDLMLVEGNIKKNWTQNSNESYTDNVQIGKGIKIKSTGTDTEFEATANGILINNTNSNQPVSEFTKYGTKTDELIVKKDVQIAEGILIQKIGEQTWFSSL